MTKVDLLVPFQNVRFLCVPTGVPDVGTNDYSGRQENKTKQNKNTVKQLLAAVSARTFSSCDDIMSIYRTLETSPSTPFCAGEDLITGCEKGLPQRTAIKPSVSVCEHGWISNVALHGELFCPLRMNLIASFVLSSRESRVSHNLDTTKKKRKKSARTFQQVVP